MEAKLCLLSILWTFILVGLFSNLLVQDSKQLGFQFSNLKKPSNLGDEERGQLVYPFPKFEQLKNTIADLLGGWLPAPRFKIDNGIKNIEEASGIPISPDLKTCHASYTKNVSHYVYCCPPTPESEEPFIDFKFPDPSEPLRIRRPAHLIDDAYIAKYAKALTIMRQLGYDDPHSFRRQADMHCIYCTGAYYQTNSTVILNIHRSWLFFPWHRMYMYFQERIIGKLLGDPTFAVPFWNWDHPDGMVIPSYYMNETFSDKDRDSYHFPPRVVDIQFYEVEHGLGPQEQVTTNLAFLYTQMVSGAQTPELFMGCKLTVGEEGYCDGPGTVELAPHNSLHRWVGSGKNPERETFGTFYSAARDPIFGAHHSNMDRLWTIWKRLRNNRPEFTDPVWLDSYFFFHDENNQLVRVKIRDVLDYTKLGYRYEEVELPWLNARPKPAVPPKIARHMLKTRKDGIESGDFGPKGRTLDAAIRAKVQRPRRVRTKKEKEEEEEVLVIYGIDIKSDMFVKFDVYVNVVDETVTGPESREFAGTYLKEGHGERRVLSGNGGDWAIRKKKSSFKVGISEVLEDLEADEDESIWVTLVPRENEQARATVDGIRIEYMR
eukprot:TRINITY_DN4720_c0_g1_i1.p1 TRINITY_DN4720_c0_g1~~TRINITY_DN4720_c0_g1_i1.p1  ORF type:complete len:604 (-),score=41.93 TRINITY_DN4720_c0_g1_i1:63-1874(-)